MPDGSPSKTEAPREDGASLGRTRGLYESGRSVVRWLRHQRKREFPTTAQIRIDEIEFALRVPDAFAATKSKTALGSWNYYRKISETKKVYEPLMLACLTCMLKRTQKPCFMDIGAFLGFYACYASAVLGTQEEVCAIESNPLYTDAIRESARVNGYSKLRIFRAALSNRVEPVSIEGLTVRSDGPASDTTITLDELCAREGLTPKIVKMDVHGAEGKIVLGMRKTLAELDCLLLEMHSLRWMRRYSPGVARSAMLDAIEDAGLSLYYVAGHSVSNKEIEFAPKFEELLLGKGYSYRRLDRPARDLLLFDRNSDEFVLGLRDIDIASLLGPSGSASNE